MRFPFQELHDLIDVQRNFEFLQSAFTTQAAVLVAGTVAVPNASVTAGSKVMLSRGLLGGTPGHLSVVLSPGVGFSINSSSATDTSTINYQVQ